MSDDATLLRSHLHDSPHLDKEIDYELYAEGLVKALKLFIDDDSNPEDTTGANGSHLLEYHITLSRVFSCAVSSPRMQKYPEVLYYILDHLSKIWTRSEWKTNLITSFCDCRFRTTFLNVVVFFEKELEVCIMGSSSETDQEGSRSYATLTTLLQLILPPLLVLLQSMQSLWTEAVASNIPDVLEDAKYMVFSEEPGETVEMLNIDEEEQEENAIRDWLETTRQSGYNVIGMCAQLEGMFDGVLDSSTVCAPLMKDLNSMGFHHLNLLIKCTVIPLVKSCPEKLWTKWVVELLYPVFNYFHCTLYESWCEFLHKGLVRVPDTIDYVSMSEEKADKLEMDFLIQLTRAASDLLAVIASPELNGGLCLTTSPQLDFICSRSLVGYVICHDSLRLPVLSLIYYILGAWKDDKAKITSVPFCHRLIQVAKASRCEELISFVQDNIIPCVIRCLTLEPNLDNTLLTGLCQEAYHCVQNQDLGCEGKYNESTEEVFQSWLINQMVAVRCRNTPFHELEEFVWTWEACCLPPSTSPCPSLYINLIEEEFRDYIPAYIDMLHEVDKMDDCLECSYSGDLFEKLKPEFVSRYAIDSASHDYVWTMSSMLSRKMSAKYWQRQNDQLHKFFCELIDFKPYIQHSSYDESVMELVENSEVYPGLDSFRRASALEQLCAMLSWLEPQFHPLIRKGHKDVLAEIVRHSIYLYNITFLQPLQPNLGDFPVHLRPCARNYLDEKNKMYHMAKEQARLHEEFDAHVSSGALDHFICKGDALNAILDDDIINSRFSVLDHTLIKLSFERRAKLLGRRDQLCSYYQHLRQVVHNEQLRIGLQSLMCELEAEGFFSIADDSIDWDKKCFSQLVEKFDKQVFVGLDLPKYYVIRGIMDYRAMSLMKDDSCSWDQVFEKVVDKPYRRWIQNIPDLLWMDTRYYKHQFYDIIHQPLQQFLPTP